MVLARVKRRTWRAFASVHILSWAYNISNSLTCILLGHSWTLATICWLLFLSVVWHLHWIALLCSPWVIYIMIRPSKLIQERYVINQINKPTPLTLHKSTLHTYILRTYLPLSCCSFFILIIVLRWSLDFLIHLLLYRLNHLFVLKWVEVFHALYLVDVFYFIFFIYLYFVSFCVFSITEKWLLIVWSVNDNQVRLIIYNQIRVSNLKFC